MGLKGVDWNAIEAPGGRRESVPPGFYRAVLMEVGSATPKAGGAAYVTLEFQVTEGEHKGRHIYDNLLMHHENATARKIAFARAKSILEATGTIGIVDDLAELKGREAGVELRSRDRKDKPGTVSIDVHRYLAADSPEVKSESAKVPEVTAPAANESAPSPNGKMPWE